MLNSDGIEILATIVTAIGVCVASAAIFFNTRRAKKELAVKLLNDWSVDYNLSMKHAFELAKLIGQKNINAIHSKSDIGIDSSDEILQAITYVLGRSCDWQQEESVRNIKQKNEKIYLTNAQCTTIDYEWMQMLHRLEAILLAWKTRAADRKIVEEQFRPLIKHNGSIFKLLIESRGVGEFPILSAFMD